VCPLGYYCLEGALTQTACPTGTFSDQTALTKESECQKCPRGTFGASLAATECQECKGSSNAPEGSTTCECIGLERTYLHKTGECICKPFFYSVSGGSDDEDSEEDCEKKIFTTCAKIDERSHGGDCRNTTDCAAECNGGEVSLLIFREKFSVDSAPVSARCWWRPLTSATPIVKTLGPLSALLLDSNSLELMLSPERKQL